MAKPVDLAIYKKNSAQTYGDRLRAALEHAEETGFAAQECSSIVVCFHMPEGPGYFIKSDNLTTDDIGMLELAKSSLSLRYLEGEIE